MRVDISLQEMTDQQVYEIAKPILLDTIYGANNKDWVQFSKHMPENHASDAESRTDVERQWDEDEYLTRFTDNPEFLAVIRKRDYITVLWKLTTSLSEDEYLERLVLEEKNEKIYQVGIWTD